MRAEDYAHFSAARSAEIFRRLNRPRGEEVAEDANNLHEAPKCWKVQQGSGLLKRSRRANAQNRPDDLKAGIIADPFDPEERAGEVSLRRRVPERMGGWKQAEIPMRSRKAKIWKNPNPFEAR
jgi:hypothetical protein